MTDQQQTLSLVVPCFNEADALPGFFKEVAAVAADLNEHLEIVAVDDGSSDETFNTLGTCAADYPALPVRAIRLSRNFGKETATSCGLHHATGDAVIIMDADLQDPPDLIPMMIGEWQAGYDAVVAIRSDRSSDGFIKRGSAAAFYSLMSRIGDVQLTPQAGDFRLLSRRLVLALNAYPERSRFMKGLFATLGFKEKLLHYERPSRATGKSRFSLWRLWNLALDGITSFSSLPLRIWSYFGFLLAITGLAYAAWIIVRTIMFGVDVPGYSSIFVSILFFSGIQLISIGILGEYLGRIFTEVKQRPLYLVDDSFGFSDENRPGPLPPQQADLTK